MKKLLLFCVLIFTQILAFSQSERLLSFSVVPIDNDQKALVKWTMSAGSTCSDVVIERRGSASDFQEIYVYPSICGDADSAISYTWIDPNPFKKFTSFYRLKLDEIEFSLVSEFNFNSKLGDNKIVIFPNPNDGFFTVDFANPDNEKYNIIIFKSDGAQIFSEENLSGKSYSGKLSFLNDGVYILRVVLQNNDSRTIKLFIR